MLTGYYQTKKKTKNKATLQKRLVKSIKIFLKKKKTKSINTLGKATKFFLKMEKKQKSPKWSYRKFFSKMQKIYNAKIETS